LQRTSKQGKVVVGWVVSPTNRGEKNLWGGKPDSFGQTYVAFENLRMKKGDFPTAKEFSTAGRAREAGGGEIHLVTMGDRNKKGKLRGGLLHHASR